MAYPNSPRGFPAENQQPFRTGIVISACTVLLLVDVAMLFVSSSLSFGADESLLEEQVIITIMLKTPPFYVLSAIILGVLIFALFKRHRLAQRTYFTILAWTLSTLSLTAVTYLYASEFLDNSLPF